MVIKSVSSPLLPDFPSVRDIALPPGIPRERVTSFLMMYRTHCHRIYDTIMRASLEEVQNFLLHFWQGMPSHLVGILGTNVVVNMVGVCDSILYRTICNVLMPTVLQCKDILDWDLGEKGHHIEDYHEIAGIQPETGEHLHEFRRVLDVVIALSDVWCKEFS
ncbi:hypothetical protein J437_LFUL018928 [Ladona fulva]|uniref:RFX1-4/6/8-like BCD domain-containing protein n=1 Tax=Ladona fulva TaxID=123851 RepID=A0A8K0KQK8_LADFU|nr:hypothetical protein J437_LFUL018928 [Ladona fulva]